MAVKNLVAVSAIRTTREAKRAYRRAAAREGLRLSEWLRRQADEAVSRHSAAQVQANPLVEFLAP